MCRIMDIVIFRGGLHFAKVLFILCDSQKDSSGNCVISNILHVTGLIILSRCMVNLVCLNPAKCLYSDDRGVAWGEEGYCTTISEPSFL